MAREDQDGGRKRQIALALYRSIDRVGIERASLREIARDAGVTTGSLTHHFADRRALLEYALGLAIDEATRRLVAVAATGTLADALAEYLPLDETRRLEGVAWLVSISAARRDPALAATLAQRYATAYELVAQVLTDRLPAARSGADEVELLVEEVLSGTDGIAVYALADPERYPPARQLELVHRLLRRLGLEDADGPPAA